MKFKLRWLFIILSVGLLTACGTMNSSFDCPNKAGVSCKSLDQVNSMVDSGQLRGQTTSHLDGLGNQTEFSPYPESAGYYPGQPLRYGETVQRIWVTPYEDSEGNYHEDSTLYTIVRKGHWIGNPLKAVTQS